MKELHIIYSSQQLAPIVEPEAGMPLHCAAVHLWDFKKSRQLLYGFDF